MERDEKQGKDLKHTSNLSNVVFLDPGLPMVHEGIPSSIVVLVLTKCPFVNDTIVASVLEERRCWWLAAVL